VVVMVDMLGNWRGGVSKVVEVMRLKMLREL
jgi:hypothetical protein